MSFKLLCPWVFLALACTPEAPLPAPDGDAVATYQGGVVTAADLDRAVLALPTEQRNSYQAGELEPFRQLIRQLVLNRLLLAEAKQQGLDQAPELRSEMDGLSRQTLAKQHIEGLLPPLAEPSEADLQAIFDHNPRRFAQPEARAVYHIFKRRTAAASSEDLVAELEQLRQRITSGENIALLAAEVSDSESRHQQGLIGRIVRGQLPLTFENAIFSLEEKVPSQPLVAADGVHLFLVESIAPARQASFAEVRSSLRQQLLAEQRRIAVAAIIDRLELPPDSFVPDTDELEALLRANDPQAVVLRIGELNLGLRRFRRLIAQEQRQLQANQRLQAPQGISLRVLNAMVQREQVYLTAIVAGEELSAEAQAGIDLRAQDLLLARYRHQLIAGRLDGLQQRLQTFYADNRRRFNSPLQVRLRRLTLSVGSEASQRMAELEAARAEIEAGRLDLQALQERLGGELEELDWQDLDHLSSREPKAALFIGRLGTGEVSPPYTTGAGAIAIFEVVDRREPEPLSFEQAEAAIRTAFLERHGPEVFRQLVDEVLDRAGLVIVEQRLATTVTPPLL